MWSLFILDFFSDTATSRTYPVITVPLTASIITAYLFLQKKHAKISYIIQIISTVWFLFALIYFMPNNRLDEQFFLRLWEQILETGFPIYGLGQFLILIFSYLNLSGKKEKINSKVLILSLILLFFPIMALLVLSAFGIYNFPALPFPFIHDGLRGGAGA